MEWAGPTDPRAWVDKFVRSERGLLTFVDSMTGKATSYSSAGSRDTWYIELKNVERFIEIKVLENQIEILKPRGQSESETRALKVFAEAVDRRRQGKPSRGPWTD
jgi:hypothetical protein